MDERALLARALDAQGPLPRAPEGFADDVLAALPARPARRGYALRLALPLSLAAASVAAFGAPWPQQGAHTTNAATATVRLGRRAAVVIEPRSALRFRVGGWFTADRVELTRGAAFFRVDHGRGFDVSTPHGTVSVTGTCFRVETRPATTAQESPMRTGWFGAGALSALVAVQVYEGGVRLARAGAPPPRGARGRERPRRPGRGAAPRPARGER